MYFGTSFKVNHIVTCYIIDKLLYKVLIGNFDSWNLNMKLSKSHIEVKYTCFPNVLFNIQLFLKNMSFSCNWYSNEHFQIITKMNDDMTSINMHILFDLESCYGISINLRKTEFDSLNAKSRPDLIYSINSVVWKCIENHFLEFCVTWYFFLKWCIFLSFVWFILLREN